MFLNRLLLLDAVTYRKLKESGYKDPNLTTLVRDPELMLALYLESLNLPVNELDILWNCQMITHTMRGFREIFFMWKNCLGKRASNLGSSLN